MIGFSSVNCHISMKGVASNWLNEAAILCAIKKNPNCCRLGVGQPCAAAVLNVNLTAKKLHLSLIDPEVQIQCIVFPSLLEFPSLLLFQDNRRVCLSIDSL